MRSDLLNYSIFRRNALVALPFSITIKIIMWLCMAGIGFNVPAVAENESSEIVLPDEVSTRITSDGRLELDYKNKVAKFFENVVMLSQNGQLKSQELILFFGELGSDIEKVIAIRDVWIKQNEQEAECQHAEFLKKEDILVLTGNPVIYKGQNAYSADKITIHLTTNHILFEPSAKILIRNETNPLFPGKKASGLTTDTTEN